MPDVIYKAHVAFAVDTALPRDQMVITPTFRDQGVTSDPDNLAQDLAQLMADYVGGTTHVHVKLYDAQGTPPVFPAADVDLNPAAAPVTSTCPREVALCLSYYSGQNRPRRRGRLYIPACLILKNTAGSSLGKVPTTTQMDSALSIAAGLKGLGGVDVDWGLWSGVDHGFFETTNYYVDDEWDTQRKRGLRPTSRRTGTGS